MKVGTYTHLSAPLLGCALLWTSAACGSRTSLRQEEDAAVVTADASAQQSSSSGGSGARAGSGGSMARAGRGATAGAGGMAGRATGGRAGRSGRAGQEGADPRGGAGGRGSPRERDAAADSGEEEPTQNAGTGGEESGGAGGEQAGAGGETAGAGGESGAAGEDAAGSGGSDAGPVDAGPVDAGPMDSGPVDAGPMDAGSEPEELRLTGLTPEQTSEICGRIDSATANLQWTEAVRGWCSRGALGTPECPASQESCATGASIVPVCSQTVPDCPDITVEEFVTCRTDTLLSFVEYNRMITCDTPAGIPGEAEVASCVGPYQRCAPLAALRR